MAAFMVLKQEKCNPSATWIKCPTLTLSKSTQFLNYGQGCWLGLFMNNLTDRQTTGDQVKEVERTSAGET